MDVLCGSGGGGGTGGDGATGDGGICGVRRCVVVMVEVYEEVVVVFEVWRCWWR